MCAAADTFEILPPADDPVALLAALIRCPSVTPAEGGALALLEAMLTPLGFRVERPVFSAPDTPDVMNLFATAGEGGPHLVFAGHTDVVPPGDVGSWSHPPFGGEVVDGVVYGRGAVDMKGGVAAFVAAAAQTLAANGGRLPGRLSLLITGDEEGPSLNGTEKLLAWCAERGERFDAAVLGEPTSAAVLGDTVKIGRRGSLSGTLTVHGRQGHAAYPEKADNPIPDLLAIGAALLAPLDTGTDRFQPSNLELVSIDVGNPAFNVIPASARLRFNVRFSDRWSGASLADELRRRAVDAAPGRRIAFALERPSEPFVTGDERLIGTVSDAIEEVTGRRPTPGTGGGTSDARYIRHHCPVVEFGLVGTTMHQVDERVCARELRDLTAVYRAVLFRWFAIGRAQ